MAIYKGRSVQIISTQPPVEPRITVALQDGTNVQVSPAELRFTKVELDRIQKEKTDYYTYDNKNPSANYKLINDKDHQELVDSQDPRKIEENRKKHPAKHSVSVPAQDLKVEAPVPAIATNPALDPTVVPSVNDVKTTTLPPVTENKVTPTQPAVAPKTTVMPKKTI